METLRDIIILLLPVLLVIDFVGTLIVHRQNRKIKALTESAQDHIDLALDKIRKHVDTFLKVRKDLLRHLNIQETPDDNRDHEPSNP